MFGFVSKKEFEALQARVKELENWAFRIGPPFPNLAGNPPPPSNAPRPQLAGNPPPPHGP